MLMFDTHIVTYKKPKLRSPIFVEGLPGIGMAGAIAVQYLVDKLKAEKFADLYSPWFAPQVFIQEDSTVTLETMSFYFLKDKKGKHDLIFMGADNQPTHDYGHYEVSDAILDFMQKKYRISSMVSLTGLGTREIKDKPVVWAVATSEKAKARFKIDDMKYMQRSVVLGTSGVLMGMAKVRGVDAVCLMAETPGNFPIDPKAARLLISSLEGILGMKIDMSELDKKVSDIESHFKVFAEMQKDSASIDNAIQKTMDEAPGYIR